MNPATSSNPEPRLRSDNHFAQESALRYHLPPLEHSGRLLSRSNAKEPLAQFEAFYGGKPEIGPLLERRGLIVA